MKKQLLERYETLVLENEEQRVLIGSYREDEQTLAEREKDLLARVEQQAVRIAELEPVEAELNEKVNDFDTLIRQLVEQKEEIADLKAKLANAGTVNVNATEAADIQRVSEAIGTIIELRQYLPSSAQEAWETLMNDIHCDTEWASNGEVAAKVLPVMLSARHRAITATPSASRADKNARLVEAIATITELQDEIPGTHYDEFFSFLHDLDRDSDWTSDGDAIRKALPNILAFYQRKDEAEKAEAAKTAKAA
ncbi:MAG: hypothetical protein HOP19_08940 [Acidobacteria bacterium]|nr:hypothetical protein [Acidobacteriota bacterium]